MNVVDFFQLYYAVRTEREREYDLEMQKTAWFTAHIMNSSGNYKRPIKSTKLYKSPYEESNGKASKPKKVDRKYVQSEQDEIKKLFNVGTG